MTSLAKFPRGAALWAALFLAGPLSAAPIPSEYRIGGFAVGCQAYTFNRFTAFEAIEKTEAAGGKVIEFYPGQPLSPDDRGVKVGHDMDPAALQQLKDKLQKHGIRAVNYGVVGIPRDEAGARKVFDFAKALGLYAITTESTDAMDTFEPLVREYDIRVAFHNHARQPNNPSYTLWDPQWVMDLVKNRDPRIGACADIGHWQTSGIPAVDGLRILSGRVVSLHAKERLKLGPGQHDVPFGTGGTDMAAVLSELRHQNFEGNISIEYEFNWDHSVPDVAQCVGFVRGWSAANPVE
ncbi:MAG: sugar phosphate isomerase/epimerase [Verrucomicrobiae bacterium]|nr:sugar phosphate isomerase/epimerase [Verrucomicrobiae bacterium]